MINKKNMEDTQDVQTRFSEIFGELLEISDSTSTAEELHLLSEDLMKKAQKIERE